MAAGRRYWALLVWVVPLGFLLAGHWPFGLALALLVSVWALRGRQRHTRADQ